VQPIHYINKKLIYGCSLILLCMAFAGCASDKKKQNDIFLKVTPAALTFTESGQSKEIEIASNGYWRLVSMPPWCSVTTGKASRNGRDALMVTAQAVMGASRGLITLVSLEDSRIAASVIIDATALTDNQPQLFDGGWYQYQASAIGSGIDIVLMGDGYTNADISGGKYELDLWRAIEGFFEIEPYRTYRPYFNVYIVGAESAASGIGLEGLPGNTRFSTYHSLDNSNSMKTDYNLCFSYAAKAPIGAINETLVILVANSAKYGGASYLWSSGEAVAICPSDNNLVPIVQHEAGGHGFGKLADEYFSNSSGMVTKQEKEYLLWWQDKGFFLNVSVKDNPLEVFWKKFIGAPGYGMVGAYKGGYYRQYGVWRPEEHSCMRHNDPYYNAPSRALITRRIKALAGEAFSINRFMENDASISGLHTYADISGGPRVLPPLASPVLHMGSIDIPAR